MDKREMGLEEENLKPQEEEKKKKGGFGLWLYRIIMVLLIGIMAFSGYKVYSIYSEYSEGTAIYNDLADEVGAGKKGNNKPQPEEVDDGKLHLDWPKLIEMSGDIKAWIRDVNTVINYPVVQGSNNDYYLYRTFTGEENGKGTIFIDANCQYPFQDFMTILYGHRMKDGSMFKPLIDYFGSGGSDYYAAHPTIELFTYQMVDGQPVQKDYLIHIFACATIDSTDAEWYRMNFKDVFGEDDEEWMQEYLNRVLSVNELYVAAENVSVGPQDKIIMMSTCTAALDDNRQVVWGKLLPVEEE